MEEKYKDNSYITSDSSFEGGDNFRNFSDMSGGNLFNKQVEINSKAEVAKSFTRVWNKPFIYSDIDVSEEINRILNSYKINNYYLLKLHSKYFINIFNFEMEDMGIYFNIKKVLQDAWLNGRSGLLNKNGKFIPVHIVDIQKNELTDEITLIKYIPFGGYPIENQEKNDYKDLNTLELKDKEIDNIAIMYWGTDAISAWIVYWPFVKLQNVLIQIMNNHSFIFNKKYAYKIQNKSVVKEEIVKFFSADNPFIMHLEGTTFENRFQIIDNLDKLDPSSFIQFYKELVGIYYNIYGRRNNNDFKQERNLVSEIKLTGESIDIIEKDFQDSFKYFIYQLKKMGVKINLLDKKEENERVMKNEIFERDNQ